VGSDISLDDDASKRLFDFFVTAILNLKLVVRRSIGLGYI
jgi:hypothetical protein